jgi:hypothetical protein
VDVREQTKLANFYFLLIIKLAPNVVEVCRNFLFCLSVLLLVFLIFLCQLALEGESLKVQNLPVVLLYSTTCTNFYGHSYDSSSLIFVFFFLFFSFFLLICSASF